MMNRKLREGRLALVGLMVAVVVTSIGATPPLNPLVIRADQQRGAVPAECDESLAPAPTPRVDVRQIPLPEPETPVAPPSASLRDALRDTQEALARNDRAAFDTALARVRSIVRGYPSGAEKRGADELLAIYTDIERMWNAQYESPFFARNSGEYAIANRYPGWEDAVRRSILTDARGERFYPAGETREFIARAAALRLSRLGVSAPYPAPRTTRETSARDASPRSRTTVPSQSTTTVSPRPAAARGTSPATSQTSRSVSTPRRETTSSRPSVAASSGTTSPSTAARRSAPARKPATRVADAAPRATSVPSGASSASPRAASAASPSSTAVATPSDSSPAATAQPLTGGEVRASSGTAPEATTEADTAFANDTALTTDTAFSVDTADAGDPASATGTSTTSIDETTGTAATPAASRGRSVLLPLILILIGLGVLVVLFRMSN